MNIENEDDFYYPAYEQGNFTEQYQARIPRGARIFEDAGASGHGLGDRTVTDRLRRQQPEALLHDYANEHASYCSAVPVIATADYRGPLRGSRRRWDSSASGPGASRRSMRASKRRAMLYISQDPELAGAIADRGLTPDVFLVGQGY